MRTSLTEIQHLENLLLGNPAPEESLLLQARMQLDAELADEVKWQTRTYEIVREYGRKQLLTELAAIDRALFTSSRYGWFQRKLQRFFNK